MLLDKMCKRTDPKQKPRAQTSKRKKSNDVVPKRKKKLTCREDKPRGRPPKTLNKVDRRKTDQKQKRRKYPCSECGEIFGDPTDAKREDEWMKCPTCNGWMHETCFLAHDC